MQRSMVVGLCGLMIGCDADSESEAWSGTVREVDGVRLVENPPEPLSAFPSPPGRMAWTVPTAEQESRLGFWEEPAWVRVADSVVYVLDRMASRVYVIGRKNGSWISSFGSEGDGPGEFRQAFGLAVGGDAVVVGNGGRASLDFFSPTGEFRESLHLGRLGFSLFSMGQGRFMVHTLLGAEGGWYVLSSAGEPVRFDWPSWEPKGSDPAPCERITADSNGVYRTQCARLAFQIVDHDGVPRQEVMVGGPVELADERKLEEHLRQVRQVMRESELPEELIESTVASEAARLREVPRMAGLRWNPETGEMAVWEQEPEDLGDSAATLHVFDADGRYVLLRQFQSPWVAFDWRGTNVYALERDLRTGAVRLVAWEFSPPQ